MAVTHCEIQDLSGSFSVGGKSTQRIVYLVTTDNKMTFESVYVGAQTASPHPIPTLYSYLGNQAYVTSVSGALYQKLNYTKWLITVTAGEMPPGTNPADQQTGTATGKPPLERQPVIWFDLQTETVPLEKDINGVQIKNSADQPIDPLSQDRDLIVIMIRKNYELKKDFADLATNFDKKHNNAIFLDFGIGTVKYQRTVSSEPIYENNTEYYAGTTSLLVDPDGHDIEYASRGWKYKEGGKLVNAREDESQLVVEPVFLAADGTKLPDGDPIHYMSAEVTAAADFSDFLKPQSEV